MSTGFLFCCLPLTSTEIRNVGEFINADPAVLLFKVIIMSLLTVLDHYIFTSTFLIAKYLVVFWLGAGVLFYGVLTFVSIMVIICIWIMYRVTQENFWVFEIKLFFVIRSLTMNVSHDILVE